MTKLITTRTTRRSQTLAALFAGFCAAALGRAQFTETAATPLDPYLITATRTPLRAAQLGTAVTAITAEDLARRQIGSLGAALGFTTGAPLMANGAPGAAAALFLRGANSNQTLFLVDGIRINDPNTDYQLFLGGACVAACDSLEVSHGPQSTLYGGEAVGGVVALRAAAGAGEPGGRLVLEAGSFGTVQAAWHAQGARDAWAYTLSVAGGHTDNARANNAFDSANIVSRVDYAMSDAVRLGATLRAFAGNYGSPGDRFTNDPDNTDRERNTLGTVFAELAPTADLTAKITLGAQVRRFESINPRPNGTVQKTTVQNNRGVLDAQASYTGIATHRLTAGFTGEVNHTRNDGFGAINERQALLAVFAQDEWSPRDDLHFTAGLRSDDHDTFGRETTGRGTVAWQVVPQRGKLRASFSTAFRSPSFLDLYGESAFYRGNPNLRPETARGWDAGVDFYLPDGRGALGVTWFETELADLIIFDFGASPGTTANVERARTRGLEIAGKLAWTATTEVRLAFSYLEADNLTAGTRLLRRPRHTVNAEVWHDFGGGFSAGAGVQWVVDREDVHARTFRRIDAEDYLVTRVFAAWSVRPGLAVKARVENALDERYEPVHGFPQPGVGGYAGVEWSY